MADGTTAIIAGLTGLLGIAAGAWLNAFLTTRRERWNLRRELYVRLLENLGEVNDTLEYLFDAELSPPSGADDETWKAWEDRIDKLIARESRAVEQIRLATSVAAIVLSDEAIKPLQTLQTEWKKAKSADSFAKHVDLRLAAVSKAHQVLVAAAKRDLGI